MEFQSTVKDMKTTSVSLKRCDTLNKTEQDTAEELSATARSLTCQATLKRISTTDTMYTCELIGASLAVIAVRNAQRIIRIETEKNNKHLMELAVLKSEHNYLVEQLSNEDRDNDQSKQLLLASNDQNKILFEETIQLKVINSQLSKDFELEQIKNNILEHDKQQLIENNQLLQEALDNTLIMSDDKHSQDTNTLNILHHQLEQSRQERDGLKGALDSIKHSLASLIPLLPTTTNITTPILPRPPMVTISDSADSGMCSQQPSSSRFNERVWSTIPQTNGSVLDGLKEDDRLSISQISDDHSISDHYQYQSNIDNKGIPELSIVHIDQSVIIPDIPPSIVNEVHIIEDMIGHLHNSIDNLLKGCVTTQAHNLSPRGDEKSKQIEHLQYKVKSLELQVPTRNHDDLSTDLEQANDKISSLIHQVEDMKAKSEEQEKETIDEVSLLKQKLVLSENEITAHRKLHNEFKERKQQTEIELRRKFEIIQTCNKKLEMELSEARQQAVEYKSLSARLVEKEEREGQLIDEVNEINDKLLASQHEIARIESRDATESILIDKQLQSEKRINEEIQHHLDKAIASFELRSEQFVRQETAMKKEIFELKEILKTKESLIKSVHSEKEKIDGQCNELSQQVSVLSQQINSLHEGLKISSDKVNQLCLCLEDKDSLIDVANNEQSILKEKITLLQSESKCHLTAYEKSIIEIQSLQEEKQKKELLLNGHEREIQQLTINNGELIERVSNYEKQSAETEECYSLKVLELQSKVNEVKSELLERKKEMCLLKETHVNDIGQIEQKLTTEYKGHIALLALQQTEHDNVLEKIAELTPELEKNANDVKTLCKKIEINKLKRVLNDRKKELTELQKSLDELSSTTDILTTENDRLRIQLGVVNDIVTSTELSMKQANTTIDELNHQLQLVITERDELEQQKQIMEQKIQTVAVDMNQSEKKDEESRITLIKCLEGERVAVIKLSDTLQNKETQLTDAVNLYLQEKVMTDKLQHDILLLQSRIQQNEQMTQLQSNTTQKDNSRLHHIDSNKFIDRARRAERRCKSLIFQKKYLQSEIDAFYHTHHGAIIMINDMGGVVGGAIRRGRGQKPTFKTVVILAIAVIRICKLIKRHKKNEHTTTSPTQQLLLSSSKKRHVSSNNDSGNRLTILMSTDPYNNAKHYNM